MSYAIQWVRSLIFIISLYLAMLVIGIVFFPWALFSTRGAITACHTFCRWVRWSASWMIGLKTEVRGTPPDHECMIAAKHQSFMDVIMIYGAVPRGKFIMKRLLMFAPIIGQYGLRIGCIPVDRGKRGAAVKKMLEDVATGAAKPGQLIIYPQGTRIAPGVDAPYKKGTAILYEQLGQDCVPVACNVGVFWPKRGIYRKPGLAVVEFLEPIKPGLSQDVFMERLVSDIEQQSNKLAAEAGFKRVAS
ncbi:1-acyl-sn-glycerol-3-phosphate acyltransferase [Cognatiyoonia koreensis]|uniref:1-acyl-sn-glycerol-3-phosphate acyltransferase n=1 Tax=Cognatiyoonia koreensis TaxID=364200 RepID=A0A1I0RD94_9RHOB|nr:lysophospholipid acyltransferase family protein [Cognatiyoonia koreensis]SEW38770.1 1-acyl-sn-glycerol-3-phosphate acyltransferase [Cognatiyoonia koreensis]